jgi:cell division protein FtsB
MIDEVLYGVSRINDSTRRLIIVDKFVEELKAPNRAMERENSSNNVGKTVCIRGIREAARSFLRAMSRSTGVPINVRIYGLIYCRCR